MTCAEKEFQEQNQYCIEKYGKPISFFIDLRILSQYWDVGHIGNDIQGLEDLKRSVDFTNHFDVEQGFGLELSSEDQAAEAYTALLAGFGYNTVRKVHIERYVRSVVQMLGSRYDPPNFIASRLYLCGLLSFIQTGNDSEGLIYGNYTNEFGQFFIEKGGMVIADFRAFFESDFFKERFRFTDKLIRKLDFWKEYEGGKYLVTIVDHRIDTRPIYTFLLDNPFSHTNMFGGVKWKARRLAR